MAVTYARIAAVRALLEAKADVDTVSKSGKTAIQYARQYNKQAIVNILVAAGSEPEPPLQSKVRAEPEPELEQEPSTHPGSV